MSETQKFAMKKISGRQVAMLSARATQKNLYGQALLEFLEYECDTNVTRLEDIRAVDFDRILKRLEEK